MSKAVHSILDKERGNLKVEGDFPLDEAIFDAFPKDSKVLFANSYGSSKWTVTARLNVQLPNGSTQEFFLKIATEDPGKAMMEGEFNTMTALYNATPNFVPKPVTWGKFKQEDPETYFFLCDFITMSNEMPDPVQFCSKLAELHRTSISPTGKFGFHIPTCHGRFQQVVDWDDSWASFFAKLLRAAVDIDRNECKSWPEFDTIADRTISHVVPRLLGVLQEDGRQLKPSLIHGDLWEGNIGTDVSNGNIYIFDAGVYFAHHEMDIGMWRCARHKINSHEYKLQYLHEMTPSEPVEEFEDRNRLYCIKMNIIHSAHHPGSIVRETAYNDMCYLVDHYAPYPKGQEPARSQVEGEK